MCESWTHTSRGSEDSARAPRMKIRVGGGLGRRPLMSRPAPVRGGCNVYRSALENQSLSVNIASRLTA